MCLTTYETIFFFLGAKTRMPLTSDCSTLVPVRCIFPPSHAFHTVSSSHTKPTAPTCALLLLSTMARKLGQQVFTGMDSYLVGHLLPAPSSCSWSSVLVAWGLAPGQGSPQVPESPASLAHLQSQQLRLSSCHTWKLSAVPCASSFRKSSRFRGSHD